MLELQTSTVPPLTITKRMIRTAARERLPESSLVAVILRQAVDELKLNFGDKVRFRQRKNVNAVQAYCAMTPKRFDGINARQRWANWRTIPKNLNRHLPDQPVVALDLCSGSGDSTEVLAYYLAPGSRIHGLEFNPTFVDVARTREYRSRWGALTEVSFRCQSVLETFRRLDGEPVPAASIDLVNCCGAVGHHFEAEATRTLAAEIARVLRPGGLALVDSGHDGTSPAKTQRIFAELGFEFLNEAKSCLVDRDPQLSFRKR